MHLCNAIYARSAYYRMEGAGISILWRDNQLRLGIAVSADSRGDLEDGIGTTEALLEGGGAKQFHSRCRGG